MLTDLDELQESEECVTAVDMSFDIETHSEDGSEKVARSYTFSYAREWDKWVFTEFVEKRRPIDEINWRKSRQILWHDGDSPSVDVPPEVSNKLQEATGADSITIQSP